jgi:hypothetical protein
MEHGQEAMTGCREREKEEKAQRQVILSLDINRRGWQLNVRPVSKLGCGLVSQALGLGSMPTRSSASLILAATLANLCRASGAARGRYRKRWRMEISGNWLEIECSVVVVAVKEIILDRWYENGDLDQVPGLVCDS